MATVDKHSRGGWRIRVIVNDKRAAFYLGKKTTKAQAKQWGVFVTRLESAANSGLELDAATQRWVSGLSNNYFGKLKKCGLVCDRHDISFVAERPTVGDFIRDWMGKQAVKEQTKARWAPVISHLGRAGLLEMELETVTEADADLFATHLKEGGVSEYTRRRYLGIAKQFFRGAVRARLLDVNPFHDQKTTATKPNESRRRFITRAEAKAISDACPDWEWRLIFGLMRFGGLRCPSELQIRWSDVLWDKKRFLVRSPKTEHLAGRSTRWVPLFPELMPLFGAAFEVAEDGAEFVLGDRRRMTHRGLAKQFKRIVFLAGLNPYPKPFQNLRSTRQTELTNAGVPSHLVCQWLGNTEKVAMEHYLQVTDADFQHWAEKVTHDESQVTHEVTQTVAACL